MRTKLFIVFLLLLNNILQAQDFDIYPRLKNDNIEMPKVYENIRLDEYLLLSKNVRMMDMAYSAIVPGYIHFKARDFATGYSLLGARLLGYSGFFIISYDMKNIGLKVTDFSSLSSYINKEMGIFVSSITLIVSSYLFDWIHGKYRLEKKQEYIRYKYSIKLKMNSMTYNNKSLTPYVSITYNF